MKWADKVFLVLMIIILLLTVSCGQQITGTTQIKIVATDTYKDSDDNTQYRVFYIQASNVDDEVRQVDIRNAITSQEMHNDFEKHIGAIYAVSIVSGGFKLSYITAARLLQESLKGR